MSGYGRERLSSLIRGREKPRISNFLKYNCLATVHYLLVYVLFPNFCTVKVSCNFHSHFPLSWNRGLYFNVFFITPFSDRYQEMGKTEHWNCITGKYPDLYRGDNKSWILKLQSRNCKIQKNKWPRQFDSAKSLPDFTTDNSLISENKAPLLSTPFSWIAHPQPSLLPTYQSVSGNLSIFSLGHNSLYHTFSFSLHLSYSRGPIISCMKLLLTMIRIHTQLDLWCIGTGKKYCIFKKSGFRYVNYFI